MAAKFAGAEAALTSDLAIHEAALAIARKRGWTPKESEAYVLEYLGAMQVTVVPIGAEEAALALDAHARFGKGRHPRG